MRRKYELPTNLKEPGGGELADLTLNVRIRSLCRVWVAVVGLLLKFQNYMGCWSCCMLSDILFIYLFKSVANTPNFYNIILIPCRVLGVQSLVQAQILLIHLQYGERETHQSKVLQASASFRLDNSNMNQNRKYSSRTQCLFPCTATSARSYHQHHQKWTSTAC